MALMSLRSEFIYIYIYISLDIGDKDKHICIAIARQCDREIGREDLYTGRYNYRYK